MPKHNPPSVFKASQRPTLKTLAEYLHLSPSTISYVLNDVPGRTIPETTRQRIRDAAAKFNYHPSMLARSLHGKPTRTIGILLPELGQGYHSQVLSGVGDLLMQEGYFYFTVHHRHRRDLVAAYPTLLRSRGVEGILAIDTHIEEALPLPTVLVAGHEPLPGATNVVLDHELAAELSLQHLHSLGHREIAFMRGQPFSSDSKIRWAATIRAAKKFNIQVREELTIQLDKDSHSPEISYPGIRKLLHSHKRFTAIVCFNDVSAIGAIRACSAARSPSCWNCCQASNRSRATTSPALPKSSCSPMPSLWAVKSRSRCAQQS